MNEEQVSLARLDQFQVAWEKMLSRAAEECIPSVPLTVEDRLRADIKNEAIWLLAALKNYRSIPQVERY